MGNLFIQDLNGTVTWEGDLSMTTRLALPNGSSPTLGGLIALTNGDALEWFEREFEPLVSDTVKAGIPGPTEIERAHSRLAILPNPNDPTLKKPEKFVESPWAIVPLPTVNPGAWDGAEVALVDLEDLYGTDSFLKRSNVADHIDTLGQAITPNRSYAMVAHVDGRSVIIDGHHRLMALWLLGHDTAPVYRIEIA